jgi:hypothetical protein
MGKTNRRRKPRRIEFIVGKAVAEISMVNKEEGSVKIKNQK